ncbi:MAG: 30S ribosomal protein S6 [Candidatus Levybacteria bacterium]|nr:30S ribosomal protein S6 [Candidatus Levybacteria bacterium]
MKKYQLVMVLAPDLKKDQKDKLLDEIKKIMGEVSGDKLELLGEKKLSYPIKRERRGEFAVLSFEADNVAQDFNKRLGIREEVLRHLLVRE